MNEDGDDVRKAMEKLGDTGRLPEPQNKLDTLTDKMAVPGPNEEAFFEERRRKGLGVGLNDDGKLIDARDGANK
ncbi:hypothetical protein V1T76_15320 [Roseibium sp. FZY0029]|uniref:hypothetical protein n=1 Tax=Roseibium sp. FZY0029 TaxID=3116647 RepID=UPI002EA23355|nr:hypothetical protein [Roseibium sp. FZY0029]